MKRKSVVLKPMAEGGKKKMSRGARIVLIIALSVLALVLVLVGTAAIYISVKYRQFDKEDIDIVEREETYEVPLEPTGAVEFIEGDILGDDYNEPDKGDELVPDVISDSIYRVPRHNPDVINILLVGRDARKAQVAAGVNGRSDSMIICSYNTKTGAIKLVSLMRDMLVPIEGYGWNRINAAYSFGGIGLCINTINSVFGLDIQNYVTIDFQGLQKLIDEIGGVSVYLTADEAALYKKYNNGDGLTEGVNKLTGSQALMHSQNRALGNDFQRTRRQRDILTAIYNQVMSTRDLGAVLNLIDIAVELVSTNISFGDMLSLATAVYNNGLVGIQSERLPFDGTYSNAYYNGMAILKIDIIANMNRLGELVG